VSSHLLPGHLLNQISSRPLGALFSRRYRKASHCIWSSCPLNKYLSVENTQFQEHVASTWITEGSRICWRKIDPMQSLLHYKIHDWSIFSFEPEHIVEIISMVQRGTVEEVDSVGIFTKSIKNSTTSCRFSHLWYPVPLAMLGGGIDFLVCWSSAGLWDQCSLRTQGIPSAIGLSEHSQASKEGFLLPFWAVWLRLEFGIQKHGFPQNLSFRWYLRCGRVYRHVKASFHRIWRTPFLLYSAMERLFWMDF